MSSEPDNEGGAAGASGWFSRPATLRQWILVFAVIALALVLWPKYLEPSTRSPVSRVRSDMRSLATAIEAYHVDLNAYPASATGEHSVNGARFGHPDFQSVPSFRIARDRESFQTITTPMAYITTYPADYFALIKGATFGYCSVAINGRAGWILISPGPDRDYDIDPARDYDPSVEQPSPRLLALAYDPTNGIVSNGDVWRVKQ